MKTATITRSLMTLAGAALACSGSLHAAAIIYDGFEVGDGTLNGNAGGTGLSGNWGAESFLTAGSLSYGNLATSGGRVTTNSGDQFQQNGIGFGTTLNSLMANGATLWFSVLMVNYNSVPAPTTDNRTYIAIGNGNADGFDRIGADQTGRGFTAALSKVSAGGITAQAWNDPSVGDGTPGATRGSTVTIANNATFLVVGSITWGAYGVADDVFNLYLPGTDLVQGSVISTLSADFDQLGTTDAAQLFNRISITGGRPNIGVPEFDELRFGASYADVTPAAIPEPSTALLGALSALALLRRRRN
jgi:hypothetical protein